MIFSVEGTFEKVKAGQKVVTRRPVKSGDRFEFEGVNIIRVIRDGRLLWEVGKEYAVQPGRGVEGEGKMRILHLEVDPNPGNMPKIEAILEGFDHPRQFKAEWIEMYGDDQLWRPAHRILFGYIPEGMTWEDVEEDALKAIATLMVEGEPEVDLTGGIRSDEEMEKAENVEGLNDALDESGAEAIAGIS